MGSNEFNPEKENKNFFGKTLMRHGRVSPCFMTGKGCVYTDAIDREQEIRHVKKGEPSRRGFMIMPFKPNFKVFFDNCLTPFFATNYGTKPKLVLERAPEASRPGVIICEGICKRIQEADFVVADISIANDNVFYELGLAYGIGQKIILVRHLDSEFGERWAPVFEASGCSVYPYADLALIEHQDFQVSNCFWYAPANVYRQSKGEEAIRLFELLDSEEAVSTDPFDINLPFNTHVLSDVGLAMRQIYDWMDTEISESMSVVKTYSRIVEGLIEPEKITVTEPGTGGTESDKSWFLKIKKQVDSSYCLIVRTGRECHPMSYFWLGYGHARGINVIPITVIRQTKITASDLVQGGTIPADMASVISQRPTVEDLAFDIRAQRHMIFDRLRPDLLQSQIQVTLKDMIMSDFREWSRRQFWERILGNRGNVSIITGALHSVDHSREMIGDWDLRAASELTSYFSRKQYRPRIETPIYQPEFAESNMQIPKDDYIARVLKDIQIQDKNCVIIASPDVNPITEITLASLYGTDSEKLFQVRSQKRRAEHEVVVVKRRAKKEQEATSKPDRVYYKEQSSGRAFEERGLESNLFRVHGDGKDQLLERFYSQGEAPTDEPFNVYAHLVIAPNPFKSGNEHYIVILSGVSGPATFALTHVLTGEGNDEFVSYNRDFDPETQSENILKAILAKMNTDDFTGLQCVIKVSVGKPSDEPDLDEGGGTYDWRRILKWELDEEVFPGGETVVALPKRPEKTMEAWERLAKGNI